MYPGFTVVVHGQDGILVAQFKSALEDVRLDVVKANKILSSADDASLPHWFSVVISLVYKDTSGTASKGLL